MYKELETILDQLIHFHKELLDTANKKSTILIERQVDELTSLLPKEEELLEKVSEIEQKRVSLFESINEGNSNLSFREFIEKISDKSVRKTLNQKRQTLTETIVQLQEKNGQNEVLLNDAIQFTNAMIGQITKSKKQHFNYQPPSLKQKVTMEARGFFDTKA